MNFTDESVQYIVDSFHYPEWTIKDWKIVFLFSERVLSEIKKLSQVKNWHQDKIVAATYLDRANLCFISIHNYYETFGVMPQVGDRLYHEEAGMIIQDRFINGSSMTITFTLSL